MENARLQNAHCMCDVFYNKIYDQAKGQHSATPVHALDTWYATYIKQMKTDLSRPKTWKRKVTDLVTLFIQIWNKFCTKRNLKPITTNAEYVDVFYDCIKPSLMPRIRSESKRDIVYDCIKSACLSFITWIGDKGVGSVTKDRSNENMDRCTNHIRALIDDYSNKLAIKMDDKDDPEERHLIEMSSRIGGIQCKLDAAGEELKETKRKCEVLERQLAASNRKLQTAEAGRAYYHNAFSKLAVMVQNGQLGVQPAETPKPVEEPEMPPEPVLEPIPEPELEPVGLEDVAEPENPLASLNLGQKKRVFADESESSESENDSV